MTNHSCIRYTNIPLEEIRRLCPACRGTCNCKVCSRVDNLIKVKSQSFTVDDVSLYHFLPVKISCNNISRLLDGKDYYLFVVAGKDQGDTCAG